MNAETRIPRAPRQPPIKPSMAEAVKLHETRVAQRCTLYQRFRELEDAIDADMPTIDPTERRIAVSRWHLFRDLAEAAMSLPISNDTDLLLQVGLAQSWIGVVVEGLPEDDKMRPLAGALIAALERATLYLGGSVPLPSASEAPELLRLIAHVVDEARRSVVPVPA